MNKNEIKIVQMKKEHLEQIDEIDKTCFENPWSFKSLETELTNPIANYFVAVYKNKVIGYGGYWWVFFEGQITNIAVHKDFRQKGVASEILNAMIKKCVDTDTASMTLEVRKSNFSAISLYKKYGFLEVGLRKRYYSDNEDAVLMTKEIKKIDQNSRY